MISQFVICAYIYKPCTPNPKHQNKTWVLTWLINFDSRWLLRALLQWRSASLCHMLGLWVEWASRKESLWLLVVAFMAKVSRLVGIDLRLPEDFSLLQRRFLFMFQSVHFWCLGSTTTSTCTGSMLLFICYGIFEAVNRVFDIFWSSIQVLSQHPDFPLDTGTLLQALQLGIYNKVPGDGREYVVCDPSAVKIRAEDGRSVKCTDISPFINNLPFGKLGL